ncbi:hypothetical protein [Agrococcus sp. SGAir0287]|uniref:hypothetical protein n=1 Tax=Agrococcus sp. SGAir0287 TaxID=2070347 RepID=UPI001586061E|nr:hypothetical protein [Agrococcus sp. SGAir0287]
MKRRSRLRTLFLCLAAAFGILTFVLLPLGQVLWIVAMPLAAAFVVIAVRLRDEGESDEDVEDAIDERR